MPEEEIILPYTEFNTAHVTLPLNLHYLELFSKIQHEEKKNHLKKGKLQTWRQREHFSPPPGQALSGGFLFPCSATLVQCKTQSICQSKSPKAVTRPAWCQHCPRSKASAEKHWWCRGYCSPAPEMHDDCAGNVRTCRCTAHTSRVASNVSAHLYN